MGICYWDLNVEKCPVDYTLEDSVLKKMGLKRHLEVRLMYVLYRYTLALCCS